MPIRSDTSQIELNGDFLRVKDLLDLGSPFIFLTGRAGTGKSTCIEYIKQVCNKHFAVLAPTGLAALNVGGQTIHSFFKLPAVPPDISSLRRSRDRKLLEKLELLIIDEISMVRADLLDLVNEALKINRGKREPFGGVQVLVVGDLFQLPPVVASEQERALLARKYDTQFFFSANCIQDVALDFVELNTIYRQKDARFISILESIREAEDFEDAIAELNQHCVGRTLEGDSVVLTTTNALSEQINNTRLQALHGTPAIFQGKASGKFEMKQERLPSPADLILKQDAQVMFTKNDPDGRWMNGTLGHIRSIHKNSVTVELSETKELHSVDSVVWETYSYQYDEKEDRIIPEVSGSYKQLPLKLAWAATIHKCQGMTLERTVIDFGNRVFAAGQAYVALSRSRAMDDISLRRPLRPNDIIIDQQIKDYYNTIRRYNRKV
ncbi:MAG: ATP-dependent DNA helicase [Bdellovibrionota bacterium]|jgi:ATP-dependent DNA helicase PIF1